MVSLCVCCCSLPVMTSAAIVHLCVVSTPSASPPVCTVHRRFTQELMCTRVSSFPSISHPSIPLSLSLIPFFLFLSLLLLYCFFFSLFLFLSFPLSLSLSLSLPLSSVSVLLTSLIIT